MALLPTDSQATVGLTRMASESAPRRAAGMWIASGILLEVTGGFLLTISPIRAGVVIALGVGCGLILLGLGAGGRSSISKGLWRGATRLADWVDVSVERLTVVPVGLALAIAARAAAGDDPRAISLLYLPLWLTAIILVLVGLWKRSPRTPGMAWSRWETAGLVALALGCLAIRAWRAGQSPFVLSGDEGSAGLTAWEFVTGDRNNLLGLGWFSFPALYFWMLSLSQTLFGRTAEAIRWVSAVGGTLAVVATYAAVRAMFGRRVAWWAAAWLALFHEHVFFSRIAYNNIWDGAFLILAAGALWIGWTAGKRQAFLLAGLATGLAQYFYTTSHVIPVLMACWLVLLAWRFPPRRDRLAGLACAAATAGVVAAPLVMLYLAHPDELIFTASRVSMLVPGWIGPAAAALGTSPLGLVLEQMQVTALGLTLAELQGVYYAPGVAMLFSLSAVLFFLGLLFSLVRVRDPRYSLLLLMLLAAVLVGGLSIQAPNSQRMLILAPVLAILVVLPLDELARLVESSLPRFRLAVTIAASMLVLAMMVENGVQLFGRYFPGEEYGSLNGEVTQSMIELFAADHPGAIYFLGGDRMGFDSIPSLAYLLPGVTGRDLAPPYDLPDASDPMPDHRVFIVLPEQAQALQTLEARYGPGQVTKRYNRLGRLLFYVLTTGKPSAAALSSSPSSS